MAKLWVREYNALARSGSTQAAMEPGTDQTPVTFTTSAQSAAFATGTTYIGIIADAAFHYVVGSNPTATTNALKVPADTLIYVGVTPGQKIAAITAA
jgi:hypothetical protein